MWAGCKKVQGERMWTGHEKEGGRKAHIRKHEMPLQPFKKIRWNDVAGLRGKRCLSTMVLQILLLVLLIGC